MRRSEALVPLHLLKLYPHGGLNRKIRPSWWRQLATRFDVEIMPRLAVLLDENGVYWIVDGQHRFLAMQSLGMMDWDVPCYVYEGATDEDAAWIIGVLNDFRDPGVGNKFKWKLLQGDEQTCQIVEIADRSGWGIASVRGGGRIHAISPLYKLHNANALTLTLRALHDAFGHGDARTQRDAVQASMLNGVGNFMILHGLDIDLYRFTRKLKRYDPSTWIQHARANRRNEPGVDTLGEGLYVALRKEWNSRSRRKL